MKFKTKMSNEDNLELLKHPKYRADIDGLRAIAVLSVVGFHAFPYWIKGGFIGVDVFFVISGFLISTIIFENLERNTFSFFEFYARRIKRIFPSLLLVLVTIIIVGWFLCLADEYKQLGKHISAGAGFVSNFAFWHESGYFDGAAETKPLLHLWSLGIEEQFYIVWPLLLWFLWKKKFNLIFIIITIAVISFSLNIWQTNGDIVAAYYSPQTRFWELLIGSFLAYITLSKPKSAGDYNVVFRNSLSFIGAIFLLIGFFSISEKTTFPGYWALLPTLGATLLIAAGSQTWINRRLLSNPLFVWIGLISFPLYLWHWPLLIFARIIKGGPPSRDTSIIIVLASIALAWLTYSFIEKKIRSIKKEKSVEVVLIALMTSVFIIGFLIYSEVIEPRNDDKKLQAIFSAISDSEYPSKLTYSKLFGSDFFYAKGNDQITLMFGDSHIEQYSPRILELQSKQNSKLNTVYWSTGGGFVPIPYVFEDNHKGMNDLRNASLQFIKRTDVKIVVIGAFWNSYFIDQVNAIKEDGDKYDYYFLKNGKRENFRGGHGKDLALLELKKFLKELSLTKKVYLLLDNPSSKLNDPKNYIVGNRFSKVKILNPINHMAKLSGAEIELNKELLNIAKQAGVEVINPIAFICNNNEYPVLTNDNKFIYKDTNHLRPFYIRSEAKYIDPSIMSEI
jgi:peptidoglycan/LPS O-acetylase OafA/YrhL